MKDHLIKELRKYSCVTGKQKTWVSQLSDDQIFALYLRIRNEESAKSIAQYIQKAWDINPGSSIHSTSQGILKFKRRIAHLLLPRPPEDEKAPDRFDYSQFKQIESLEELRMIAELQRARIQRMMLEEQELGIKHSNLSRDLQSLATLTKVIMAQKEFEIMHENDDPVKLRMQKNKEKDLQRRFDRCLDKFIPTLEDREEMCKVLDKFLEDTEKMVVTIDMDNLNNK